MTKNDLATALAEKNNIGKGTSIEAIDSLIDILKDSFAKGESVYLRGFGTFKIEQRQARQARDISRKEQITLAPHKVVKFIPCVELKKAVR